MQENDPNQYLFPRRINDPLLIFIFPAVQIVPAVGVVMVGALMGYLLYSLILSITLFVAIGKFLKDSFIDEPIHKAWKAGLLDAIAPGKSRTVANPVIKKYFN